METFIIPVMEEKPDSLEKLWDDLLSRQPEKVRSAFFSLTDAEQAAVLAHLQRMASEAAWQPELRASARSALVTLGT
jgi:hypothetical protein